jgi:hypothetical protein
MSALIHALEPLGVAGLPLERRRAFGWNDVAVLVADLGPQHEVHVGPDLDVARDDLNTRDARFLLIVVAVAP